MRQSALYPYPTVQYIPLKLDKLVQKEALVNRPFLLLGSEITSFQKELEKKYDFKLSNLTSNGKFLILAAGLELLEVKYRGFYVTIKGLNNQSINLYTVPANYFYKESLMFQVKEENGNILASKLYKLKSQ